MKKKLYYDKVFVVIENVIILDTTDASRALFSFSFFTF